MQLLNLPAIDAKITEEKGKKRIFDGIRKKYVALTPEEWVRQHFIHYLVNEMHYPAGLIAVETMVTVNRLRQRADIVVYSKSLRPALIVECKAPEVVIGQQTLNQAARYNIALGVHYLVVTNGMATYCIELGSHQEAPKLLQGLPVYDVLTMD